MQFACPGGCFNAATYNTQAQLLVVMASALGAKQTNQSSSKRVKRTSQQDNLVLSIHRLTAQGELSWWSSSSLTPTKFNSRPVLLLFITTCGVAVSGFVLQTLSQTATHAYGSGRSGHSNWCDRKQGFCKAVQGLIPRRHGLMVICRDALWFVHVPDDRAGITGQARRLCSLDTEPYRPVRYWHNDQRMVCATGNTIYTYVF